MDPAPTCFPLQLIIPEGWPPSSQSPSTSLILGGGNGSRTLLRGLGMSFFNLSISMESNRSCFKWTATSWLRFGAIHTLQLHSNHRLLNQNLPLTNLFPLSFSPAMTLEVRLGRATLVHPDILENAALEKFDGVDKHVSKKLQVDKLSQVSSALSTTRHQEFVSAQEAPRSSKMKRRNPKS
ncbi:hypothetical protein ACFX13_008221 [Malus domestica]